MAVAEVSPSPSLGTPRNLGTVSTSTALPAGGQTFTGLKQDTPYVAVLYTSRIINSWRNSNAFARLCFRTAADLERPLAHHDDINHGGQAGGCFAFADLNGPNHRQKANACLCGARNSSGQWAQTDAEDGYEYISSPGYRTTLGCTTN